MKEKNKFIIGLVFLCMILSVTAIISETLKDDVKIIYENISVQVPIYENITVETKSVYYVENDTLIPGFNRTELNLTGYETQYIKGKKIAIKIFGKYYYDKNLYVNDDNLVRWGHDIGDRNFNECPGCQCEFWTKPESGCVETEIKGG